MSLPFSCNSKLSGKYIKQFCSLSSSAKILLEDAFLKFSLSARTYDKILKIARSIADLEGEEEIKDNHLAEAIQYRTMDRKYWKI